MYIRNGAVVTHTVNTATSTNALGEWEVDSRIRIQCIDLTVDAGGRIDANGKGWGAPSTVKGEGYGPGGGGATDGFGAGGSYGGRGGNGGSAGTEASYTWPNYGWPWPLPPTVPVRYKEPYGSAREPVHPGSGGGAGPGGAGWAIAGGGLVRIEADGLVTVNGCIAANGLSGRRVHGMLGSGSGGGIFIECDRFAGAGSITADGGETLAFQSVGGAGGGGRIAVVYDLDAQATVTPKPSVTFSAWGFGAFRGGAGSVYMPNADFFPTGYSTLGGLRVEVPGFSTWAPESLTITGLVEFVEGFALSVQNDLVCATPWSGLEMTNATLTVGGSLTITNRAACMFRSPAAPIQAQNIYLRQGYLAVESGATNLDLRVQQDVVLGDRGRLYLQSRATSGTDNPFGGLLTVHGTLNIQSNGFLHPGSHPFDGGAMKIVTDTLIVASNGYIHADSLGFAGSPYTAPAGDGYGDGKGIYVSPSEPSGGAGYGGYGGQENENPTYFGQVYGDASLPLLPGSGGAGFNTVAAGGRGGGLIWIETQRDMTIDGTVRAVGGEPLGHSFSSSGSGGGIYLVCQRNLSGTGQLIADGGRSQKGTSRGGVGGGGRIAVYRRNEHLLNASVAHGVSSTPPDLGWQAVLGATDGTIFWGTISPPGTLFLLR